MEITVKDRLSENENGCTLERATMTATVNKLDEDPIGNKKCSKNCVKDRL